MPCYKFGSDHYVKKPEHIMGVNAINAMRADDVAWEEEAVRQIIMRRIHYSIFRSMNLKH